ncbi:MAG: phosphoribosylamine--glycine ligase, partial [Terriglobia bacterium]
ARMTEALTTSRYVGYVDINCVANANGIYPLEFTCRFGYPTISVQMEGIRGKWGAFFVSLARGETFMLKVKRGFQVGAVIAVPPFPYYDKAKWAMYRGLPILFKRPNREGVHLGDVKFVRGDWCLAGESGYALVVTGSGPTVQKARRQMHRRIRNIILQGMFYRNDIGVRWAGDTKKLKQWGYLS